MGAVIPLKIGANVGASTSGSALYVDSSTKLAQDNTNFFWDASNLRLFLSPHATPPTQPSKLIIADTVNVSAFTLAGKGNTGGTQTEGARFYLANNSSGNIQMLLMDSSKSISNDTSTATAIRFGILGGVALIDARSTDNSTQNVLNIGNDGAPLILAGTGIAVNQDSSNPGASAILDVKPTTKGFLPPRMTTTQKNAISSPAEGLVLYDATLHKLAVYTGSAWETVTSL